MEFKIGDVVKYKHNVPFIYYTGEGMESIEFETDIVEEILPTMNILGRPYKLVKLRRMGAVGASLLELDGNTNIKRLKTLRYEEGLI